MKQFLKKKKCSSFCGFLFRCLSLSFSSRFDALEMVVQSQFTLIFSVNHAEKVGKYFSLCYVLHKKMMKMSRILDDSE
jgi:hypothetical protein